MVVWEKMRMLYQTTFQAKEDIAKLNVSCVKYYSSIMESFPYHCHPFYEISYLVSGKKYETINGKKMNGTSNGLVYIKPLEAHCGQNLCRVEEIILQFSHSFLYNNSGMVLKESVLIPSEKLSANRYYYPQEGSEIYRYIHEITEICPGAQDENPLMFDRKIDVALEWKISGLTLSLLSEMLKEGLLEIKNDIGNATNLQAIEPVLQHILSHPEIHTDMHEAAELSNMSYSNFSRTFKTVIGNNYVDFCNFALVLFAEDLLRNSNLSITQISEKLNIETISYFNRLFKKYTGSTPLKYRKSNKINSSMQG
jgi:AraC-like DNA-binding protein